MARVSLMLCKDHCLCTSAALLVHAGHRAAKEGGAEQVSGDSSGQRAEDFLQQQGQPPSLLLCWKDTAVGSAFGHRTSLNSLRRSILC